MAFSYGWLIHEMQLANVVLFLGAGADLDSQPNVANRRSLDHVPLSAELATILCEESGFPYEGDDLSTAFSGARSVLGENRFRDIFEDLFLNVIPSTSLTFLAHYHWARIYTTNISDSLGRALENSPQRVTPRSRFDAASEIDVERKQLDLVYLNGYVQDWSAGLIFTDEDYAEAQSEGLPWFSQLAEDLVSFPVVYVGTKLKEPTISFYLAKLRRAKQMSRSRGILVTPSPTAIYVESARASNMDVFDARASDFCDSLRLHIPAPWTTTQISETRFPILRSLKLNSIWEQELIGRLTLVDRSLASENRTPESARDYYRGFKPGWNVIYEEIPALLEVVRASIETILQGPPGCIYLFHGGAGSGKSTALKQVARAIQASGSTVYFLETEIEHLDQLISTLERVHEDTYFLFLERASWFERQLRRVFLEGRVKKGVVVTAEASHKLRSETGEYLVHSDIRLALFDLSTITGDDADCILEKFSKYGPASAIARLPRKEQRKRLLEHARRQLLIGLLEATSGVGFRQMIDAEFTSLKSEDAREFVVVAGMPGLFGYRPTVGEVSEALKAVRVSSPISDLLTLTHGIVRETFETLECRHPSYIKEVLQRCPERIPRVLGHYLDSFEKYCVAYRIDFKRLGKRKASFFKALTNHRRITQLLGEASQVEVYYASHYPAFKGDPMYLLQYALAERHMGEQQRAMTLLGEAKILSDIDYVMHSFAQQCLIVASLRESMDAAKAELDEGLAILRRLDAKDDLFGGRYYPLVSMAEGHVFVLRKLDSDERAAEMAKEYANALEKRLATAQGRANVAYANFDHAARRAKIAYRRLAQYSYTRKWHLGQELGPLMSTDLPLAVLDW